MWCYLAGMLAGDTELEFNQSLQALQGAKVRGREIGFTRVLHRFLGS